jgi:hypothetical protein
VRAMVLPLKEKGPRPLETRALYYIRGNTLSYEYRDR